MTSFRRPIVNCRRAVAPFLIAMAYSFQLFAADVSKGADVFLARCSMCHDVKLGETAKYGPNLHNLFGRQAGALPGYAYSSDLRESGFVWDARTLDDYLADPHKGRQRDKMPYPGLASKTLRDNLIAYLEQATR